MPKVVASEDVSAGSVTRREAVVPDDHPCLPGHFPSHPIVPAVVILDEVGAAIADTYPARRLATIDHCKFQGFVRPNHPFWIELTSVDAVRVDFTCLCSDDGRTLATGRFRITPLEAS
ncbi:MAG: hydroxymyristoyl-ACP dehydratase [Geminicoccaceae bacterium]